MGAALNAGLALASAWRPTALRSGMVARLSTLSYGWVIVAAVSFTEMMTWGIVYYGFPAFLDAMETDLHASQVAITGAFSAGLGIAALAAIPVGRWLDRYGARLVMTVGSCLGTVLVLAWSRVETLPGLYAVWCLMGFAMAATLYEPAFAAVIHWFTRHRDRALMIVALVGGLASTIFMPLETWLIARLGWRQALVTLALALAVTTVPIHAFVLQRAPHLAPRRPDHRGPDIAVPGVPLAVAMRRVVFWVLAGAFVIGNFAHASVTVHLIQYLEDYGYATAVAAAALAWVGAMQVPGRLFFVPIASRLGARWLTATIFFAQGLGMAQLAVFARVPIVAPVAVLLGVGNGMSTLARALTVSDIFGRRHYGSISGAMAFAANGARALAPIGASLLYLGLGGYERLFGLLAGALAIAGFAVLQTRTAVAPTDAPASVAVARGALEVA